MRASVDHRAGAGLKQHLLAAVLVVEHQAVEKGVEVHPATGFGAAVDAARIGYALAHQVFHGFQIAPEFVFLVRRVHHFDPQLHARDGGLQIMGYRRQQLHALLEVGGDARLQ
ncbi:hypothetical protein D3C79_875300 [compost metagenome]